MEIGGANEPKTMQQDECVVADLVVAVAPENAESTYGLVRDAQHIAFLQRKCRIYGTPEGAGASSPPLRLRLALEEIAVGIACGFLRLQATTTGVTSDHADHKLAAAIAQELVCGGQHSEQAPDITWKLPPRRHARLRVFRDLWEKGYVVTFGSKFGADFLIYKEDPTHAHAVALIVVKEYEESFPRVDVVSFCRVAKMVKKQLLFACVRPKIEKVEAEPKTQQHDRRHEDESKRKHTTSMSATGSVMYVSITHALLVSRQEEGGEEEAMEQPHTQLPGVGLQG